MENVAKTHCYTFDSFRFDAAAGELSGPDRSVKLRPQAALALDMLLSGKGEVVSRTELRKALWPDERVVMFEASIAAVIRELRRALGDDSKAPRFIETVPKRGYRFVTRAMETDSADAAAAAERSLPQKNRGGFLRLSGAVALGLVGLLIVGTETDVNETLDVAPVTVAVLPFEVLSRQPAHGVLADTLPRELVGWLGTMAPERLRVVDRIEAEETGGNRAQDDLPVDFVITGSVRDDRSAAVVSAKMLAGVDGGFTWGESYRRNAEDAGLVVREIAARIADGVASKSLPQWRNGSAAMTVSRTAADAFHRGTDARAQLSREGTLEAVAAFREAIELDPAFSEAYAHFAAALIGWPGPPVTPDRVLQARHAARTSIELAPTNAVGHRVLGEIGLYYDRDWQAAGSRLERSIELSPSDASGHHSYAAWLSARGRHDEALREIDLAAALEPGSVAISIDVMFLHYYGRDFEGTVSAAQRLKQLWPGNEQSHTYIMLSRQAMGDIAGAADEARIRLAGSSPTPSTVKSVSMLSDTEALEAYWTATLRRVQRYIRKHSGDPATLAMPNVQLGRLDAATTALEAALTPHRFSYYLPYLGVSPAFDPMCGHPGFESILRRLRQSALSSGTDMPRCAAAIAKSMEGGAST